MKKCYSDIKMKMYNISMEEKIATVCHGGVIVRYVQNGWACGSVATVDVNTASCIVGTWGDQEKGIS